MIRPTEWELDKANLDLIYADVVRTTARTGAKEMRLREAISIAEHSYATFERHAHERMVSRSAFTLALLNYYVDDFREAELRLEEVERFSGRPKGTRAGDAKWLANCLEPECPGQGQTA